jgi:Kae1-associated kinase Bud32
MDEQTTLMGAEAQVTLKDGVIYKQRIAKAYRQPQLDLTLRTTRTKTEAKLLQKASNHIAVPRVLSVTQDTLCLQHIAFPTVRQVLSARTSAQLRRSLATQIGQNLAKLHNASIMHGDLTTSNLLCDCTKKSVVVFLIDFGLATHTSRTEDRAVDLHLLHQALVSYHTNISADFFAQVLIAYTKISTDSAVLSRLAVVQARGKNKQ